MLKFEKHNTFVQLTLDLGMNKDKVEHLVDEETEDVSNILKHIAPKLVNQASELFPLRKRLQRLRLSPENVAILEKVRIDVFIQNYCSLRSFHSQLYHHQ